MLGDQLKPDTSSLNQLKPASQPKMRKEQRNCHTIGHLTPSLDNQELTSIIFSLAHTLKGLRQETNELKLQVTVFQRDPTPAQQEKEQDRRMELDRMVQQKEITSLQESLTAAGHKEQLEKATRKDMERELFHTKYKGGSQSLLLDTSQVSFQETSETTEGTELIQTNSEVTHEVTLKEFNKMARNIPAFTPELAEDHDVHAYMRDTKFFL
ncbi:hypothetical protein H4Q32_012747 [Labeo rohita]|uniref:Uncharacterized protein n=1 Tax=Labeo rohita TaxID=84645 RepID=A0ABQ8LZ82_LABRO|nr:hypothetical protein H4Q32_012747 [Labeo rohita]